MQEVHSQNEGRCPRCDGRKLILMPSKKESIYIISCPMCNVGITRYCETLSDWEKQHNEKWHTNW